MVGRLVGCQARLGSKLMKKPEPLYEPTKWDRRGLDTARWFSQWSKDPSTQVGAAIVGSDHRIISIGFNGFPKGVADDERLQDRATKYRLIIHAEDNAMQFAKCDLTGCTVYTWPFLPCSRCASKLIQRGVKRVVAPWYESERWNDNFQLSYDVMQEAGVEVLVADYPTEPGRYEWLFYAPKDMFELDKRLLM